MKEKTIWGMIDIMAEALKRAGYDPTYRDISSLVKVLCQTADDPKQAAKNAVWDGEDWVLTAPGMGAGFLLAYEENPRLGVLLADRQGGWDYWSQSGMLGCICRFVYRQMAPYLREPEESEGSYAAMCGRTSRTFQLPFEATLAIGPSAKAASQWRQARRFVTGLTGDEVFDLVAGIDRRRKAIGRVLELAGASDEYWARPLSIIGQVKTKALADDLLREWERQLLNHGIYVVPQWATLAVKTHTGR